MLLKSIPAWAALTAAVIVTACGGGGGGGIGGTGSPVASYGGVTAIGSVWVNGVRFNVDNASIVDRSNTTVVPKAGMVVQVDGLLPDAQASKVTVEGSLRGIVEAVGTDQITVMGQTVRIDDTTCGDSAPTKPQRPGCGTLIFPAKGVNVEVHGMQVSDSVIQGGYVRTTVTPPFAVKGYVKELSANPKTFKIGTLVVDYQNVNLSTLANGQFVEVKGPTCAGTAECGTLTADAISISGVSASNGAQVEVEGYVTTADIANGTFTLGNQVVTTSNSTSYVGGVLDDILLGTEVEVEGTITNGVLAARKVQFRDSVRIEADVATRVGSTLTFSGLPGVSVTVNSFTDLTDVGGSIGNIVAGDHVRMRGRPAPGNAAVVLRIEDRSASNNVDLQSIVTAVNGATLTILGIAVDTSQISNNRFRDTNGNEITRAQFLAAAQVNVLVKAKGTRNLAGTAVTWTEIELED